jgi:2-C-methyl-D-erythritol 4-phosphate cytidylyltransferase
MPLGASPLSLAVILVAAGSGKRLPGSVPKQWRPLGKIPLLAHSFRFFDAFPQVRQLVVALDAQTLTMPERTDFLRSSHGVRVTLVAGGAERQESVWNALQVLEQSAPDIVMIHDAARPFPPMEGVLQAIETAAKFGGSILARPITETVKRVDGDGKIVETLDRRTLYAAQTPQVFQFPVLVQAYRQLADQLGRFTDDAVIFEAAGGNVLVVNGSENNFKVTHPEDFVRAENLLK